MDSGWQRLGRAVKSARIRAGYARARDLAGAAHVGLRTVELLEAGTHPGQPRETTLARIEAALGWADGSALAIVGGGQPRGGEDPTFARLRAVWAELTPEQRAKLAQMAENYLRQR